MLFKYMKKYIIKGSFYDGEEHLLFFSPDKDGKEYNIVCFKKTSIVLIIVIVASVVFVIVTVVIVCVLLKKKKKKKDASVKESEVTDLTKNKEQERSYDHILKNNYIYKDDTKKIK